jgi:hypothetical protein
MTNRRISIYRRDGVYLFCPSSKTTAGVWLDHEPGFGLSVSVSPEILGHTLLSALSSSGPVIPHPTDWKTQKLPLLQFTGAKGWRGFVSAVISFTSVEMSDMKFTIDSWQQDGQAFLPSGNPPVELPLSASADELARAVISSFTTD